MNHPIRPGQVNVIPDHSARQGYVVLELLPVQNRCEKSTLWVETIDEQSLAQGVTLNWAPKARCSAAGARERQNLFVPLALAHHTAHLLALCVACLTTAVIWMLPSNVPGQVLKSTVAARAHTRSNAILEPRFGSFLSSGPVVGVNGLLVRFARGHIGALFGPLQPCNLSIFVVLVITPP